MRPEIQRVYLQDLRSQCLIAHQSIEDLTQLVVDAHIEEELTTSVGVLVPRFWYCTQAFLGAAANISKMLWPPSTKAEKRGHDLRNLLGINATAAGSPLDVKGRDLRNDFEHLDERLDAWAGEAEATGDYGLLVRVIGAGPPHVFGIDPKVCFLYFDA